MNYLTTLTDEEYRHLLRLKTSCPLIVPDAALHFGALVMQDLRPSPFQPGDVAEWTATNKTRFIAEVESVSEGWVYLHYWTYPRPASTLTLCAQ